MQQLMAAVPHLLLNGWAALLVVVAAAVVFAQDRRVAGTEAELYGAWLHSPWHQLWRSLAVGAIGALAGSAVLVLAGVGLVEVPGAASAILFLVPVSIALGTINPRLICYAYSGALISLSHLIFGWPVIDVPSVLGLVGFLYMVEALLIRISGDGCTTPMSVRNPYGETVSGYNLKRFWPVPLVLPLFSAAAGGPVDVPSWWPIVSPDPALVAGLGPLGWQLMPVVVVIGDSDLAIAAPPWERIRQASRSLLLYSGILLALAVGAGYFRPLMWVGALFSALGHEAMAVRAGRVQLLSEPYLKRPGRGVAVLDVVHNREQLQEALLASPGYVRIMYRQGREISHCRVPRPPEGLVSLGVICLPEPGDRTIARMRLPAFFRSSLLEK